MDFLSQLKKFVDPLQKRILNMVSRGVVSSADAAQKVQVLKVDLLDTETREVEHFQQYGLASAPKPGAEVVVIFAGGRRDHGLAIGTEDRRYRISNLESGEVAVYDATGSKIVLKSNGDIEITPSSGTAKFVGDVTVSGTLTATTDVVGGGKSLKNHTHNAGTALLTGASSGAPVTGITGAPV